MTGEQALKAQQKELKIYYYSNHLALVREGDEVFLDFRTEQNGNVRLKLTTEQCVEMACGFDNAGADGTPLAVYNIRDIIERRMKHGIEAPRELDLQTRTPAPLPEKKAPTEASAPRGPKKKKAPPPKAPAKRQPKKMSARR